MKPEFISEKEKLEIIKKLTIYGINHIPYLLVKSGNEKIRAFSGNLSKEELNQLANSVFTETLGIYFAKIDGNDFRLSLDALHLLKNQIKENIIELDDKQAEEYLKGNDTEANQEQLNKAKEKIYYVLKYKSDILGMSKIVQNQIKNYLPKERRRKN